MSGAGLRSFFVLASGGHWQCERRYGDAGAGGESPGNADDGKFARIAGMVSVLLSSSDRAQAARGVGRGGGKEKEEEDFPPVLSAQIAPDSSLAILPLEHHTLVVEVDPRVIVGSALPACRLRRVAELFVLLLAERSGAEDSQRQRRDTAPRDRRRRGPRGRHSHERGPDDGSRRGAQGGSALEHAGSARVRPQSAAQKRRGPTDAASGEGRRRGGRRLRAKRAAAPRLALLTHGCRSVLHSTIPSQHLQHLMTFLKLRPLGPFLSTTTPVFHETDSGSSQSNRSTRGPAPSSAPPSSASVGTSSSPYAAAAASKAMASKASEEHRLRKWFQMVVLRVQRGVLVGEFPIDTDPKIATSCLEDVQHRLYESCDAILPAEEPPVPLHVFVGQGLSALPC